MMNNTTSKWHRLVTPPVRTPNPIKVIILSHKHKKQSTSFIFFISERFNCLRSRRQKVLRPFVLSTRARFGFPSSKNIENFSYLSSSILRIIHTYIPTTIIFLLSTALSVYAISAILTNLYGWKWESELQPCERIKSVYFIIWKLCVHIVATSLAPKTLGW